MLRAYVTGNQEGRDWLPRRCEEQKHQEFQRQDDHAYAQDRQGLPMANSVLTACRQSGAERRMARRCRHSFPFAGGVRLPDQAQLDPRPVLDSLVAELESHGGVADRRPRDHVRSAAAPEAICDCACIWPAVTAMIPELSITTKCCVLATEHLSQTAVCSLLDSRRIARTAWHSDVPGDITRSMFIFRGLAHARCGTRRPQPGDKLIVGGAGHPVGRSSEPTGAIGELAAWTQSHYPGAVQTH